MNIELYKKILKCPDLSHIEWGLLSHLDRARILTKNTYDKKIKKLKSKKSLINYLSILENEKLEYQVLEEFENNGIENCKIILLEAEFKSWKKMDEDLLLDVA
tara:strand:+ start:2684 stop:2992 length:309 start_codon:yes stop_codon:yes gene_type:complete